jgi:hypothetical protein
MTSSWIVRVVAVGVLLGAALLLWRPWQERPQPAAADLIAPGGCMTAQINQKFYADRTWHGIGRDPDGGQVLFDPKGMICDLAKGVVDVAIQIDRPEPIKEQFDDGTVFTTLAFTRDRYFYRLRCKERTFALLERRIMGEGEASVRTIKLSEGADTDFRPFTEFGPISLLEGPACKVALGGAGRF